MARKARVTSARRCSSCSRASVEPGPPIRWATSSKLCQATTRGAKPDATRGHQPVRGWKMCRQTIPPTADSAKRATAREPLSERAAQERERVRQLAGEVDARLDRDPPVVAERPQRGRERPQVVA